MTPDTVNYFVAGYTVIVIGITGYIFSLVIRSANLKRKLNQKSQQDKVRE
jgi:CcmD family protein